MHRSRTILPTHFFVSLVMLLLLLADWHGAAADASASVVDNDVDVFVNDVVVAVFIFNYGIHL